MKHSPMLIAGLSSFLAVVLIWTFLSRDSDEPVDPGGAQPAAASASVASSPDHARGLAPDPTSVSDRDTRVPRPFPSNDPGHADTASPPAPPPRAEQPPRLFGLLVNTEDGATVAGVEVSITSWSGGLPPRPRRVMSDRLGRFDFGVVHNTSVNLSTRHRDFVISHLSNVPITGEPLEIALSEGAVIEGTVVTSEGDAAANAHIRVQTRSGDVLGESVADAAGSFRISALPAGSYELVVVSRDSVHNEESGEESSAAGQIVTKTEVEVEVGAPSVVTIELPSA